jgi:cephalosporin-C deacetylase-like acetyl esterase
VTQDIRRRREAGEPVLSAILAYNAELATRAVPDWRATLDALQDGGAGGPVGFWGVSQGSCLGLPLTAVEPRITAAVFGLVAYDTLGEVAARITIPLEFWLQWDDELVPRESGLALFDAFASRDKTLHAHPGRHAELPVSERESSQRFLASHLLTK